MKQMELLLKHSWLVVLALSIVLPTSGAATEGLISVKSAHDVGTTADRLESRLGEKGMTVFIRIDHAAGARKVGRTLRPTELVIFGNPKVGTPLMQCRQQAAIDLPQKMMIWEDERGDVWLSYNDPLYVAGRHGMQGCDEVIGKISGALKNFADAAVGP